MDRITALERLQTLIGKDLHQVAEEYGVPLRGPSGKVNKGWAGHVFERYLGVPLNSAQAPNFGSWELKSVPLITKKSGDLTFKETMAVTMIDAYNVQVTPFEESHLLSKLKKAIVVARIVPNKDGKVEDPTYVHSVNTIDLEGEIYEQVEKDYKEVQDCISDVKRGFDALTGKMGEYIQPRTKGQKDSTSRAFYARKEFLEIYIDLKS